MAKVTYKEPSNYFPEDLMRELMEDGKRNIEKKNKNNKKTETTKKTDKSKKKK